ncbi:MAG: hypothetical protein ABEK01_02895 [Candidatus Nanohaloarchaea archaeon]
MAGDDKAERQKEKAKEMLGITENRAEEIFDEGEEEKDEQREAEEEDEEGEEQEEEPVECPDCGKEFDSKQGMRIHRGQMH